MIHPKEGDVGRAVIYRASHLRADHPGEEGVITSFNDWCVFVRYGADKHCKATSRINLEWAQKETSNDRMAY